MSQRSLSQKSRLHVLRDMIIFVEVGRRENFTRAAKALGISLSTLARRIATLEQELGMLLIERTTRHQRLTPDGRQYFERCPHVVDDALFAYDEVHAQACGLSGTIRLAVPSDFHEYVLCELLSAFLIENPGLQVSVEVATGDTLPGDRIDLLMRIGEPSGQVLVTKKIGTIGLRLYAASSYLDARPAIGSRQDLKSHAMLVPLPCEPYGQGVLRTVPKPNINLGGRLQCDTFNLTAALAASGHGVAVLPPSVAEPLVTLGRLVPVLAGWTAADLPIFVVMTSRLLPARLRTFLSFMTQRLRIEGGPRVVPEGRALDELAPLKLLIGA